YIAIFILGLAWASFRANLALSQSLPPALANETVNITAEIVEAPEHFPHKAQIVVRARKISLGGQDYAMPGLVRLALYRTKLSLHAGETWQFLAKLKNPHGFSNPGLFDYEKYLFQKRIRATGYVKKPDTAIRLDDGRGRFSIHRMRQELADSVLHALGESPASGLIVALATGIRSGITAQQWDVMRATGTNHLMAISGLHIGLFAGAVYWLFVKLWSRLPRLALWLPAQKAAIAPALLAAVFYAALAGFTIPVQRALVMLIIALLALAVNRKTSPLHILALALTGVLLFDPLSVMSAGFWLSFSAVSIIAWAVSGVSRRGKAGQAVFVQVAVSLGLIPLLLLFFGQFSWLSPLANLLAVPVIGLLVTPVVLLGVVLQLAGLGNLSATLWQVAAQVTSWLWQTLTLAQQHLPAVLMPFSPAWWTIPAALLGILLLLSPKGVPGRALGALWLLPLFLFRPDLPGPGEIHLSVLDVGQGLALVVQSHNNTLVYDVGRRYSDRFDVGADIVAPYLRRLGVDHVDQLIVSHEDEDHRGGVPGLRKEMPVSAIYSSVPELFDGAQPCHSGQSWRDGAVEYQVLYPLQTEMETETELKDNNLSCVVLVSGPYGAVLIPGDIEKKAEQLLLEQYGDELQSTILLAPHHGSKTSSSVDFIDAVNPRLALFSTGLRNRFHHPHAKVRKRYRDRQIETLNTAWSGAITVTLAREGVTVDQQRLDHRRFWQTSEGTFTP
ncbi:MAG: DNA internalization-related competence protein ComEC/Rec2, partial [Gammaproteobacteria bacterium]